MNKKAEYWHDLRFCRIYRKHHKRSKRHPNRHIKVLKESLKEYNNFKHNIETVKPYHVSLTIKPQPIPETHKQDIPPEDTPQPKHSHSRINWNKADKLIQVGHDFIAIPQPKKDKPKPLYNF